MQIILYDSHIREQFFPFTHTRHLAEIRIGIFTIKEKWEMLTGQTIYLSNTEISGEAIKIPANIIPTLENFENIINASKKGEPIFENEQIKILKYPWHIFKLNDWAMPKDFEILRRNKTSGPISDSNKCISPENIFIEPGAVVEHSILNASLGPIYIGKNALIMEGNMIRGPFAMCEGSILKMGSKIYGATTIGPYCVAGGEIKNSILFGYSNKALDGYLGDSVIGEWCNLGAGTSVSNVKNTGGEIKYSFNKSIETISAGSKAGLLMGDYSRTAINTSFNTGAVVGVCCNIYGQNSTVKYFENFSWGTARYDFNKAIRDIENWKKLKNQTLTQNETALLQNLYNI